MKQIEVVAAVIIQDNKIFAAQRNNKGEVAFKWEFPGGKIEQGESHKDALIRELKEELNIDTEIGEYVMTVNHTYQTFSLTMHAYLATILTGSPKLTVHVASRWLSKSELDQVDWALADVPIVASLKTINIQ